MATAPDSFTALPDLSPAVAEWVEQVRQLTTPDKVQWCDGSQVELARLKQGLEKTGELKQLNQTTFPGCHLAYSHPSDVARVEHLTFICTQNHEDAGPNNHWMAPDEARGKMRELFRGCMKGRTLYVVPYCMGPVDSPYSRCGVEITDSAYVVINMSIMTRMGRPALERIARDGKFVRGLHSIGELDPDRRFIMHYPEELAIESYGSGYGGNALLGKKCHALRIASWQAREEGWLAEHMLIVGIENPQGETHYIAAAFPSACGKTNLAMLIPPASMPGWKVWTVGDDIAWMHPGPDGRLYAINPEAGYFGVVPGTNRATNKNAFDMIHRDTLFTNVALTADDEPWWEGRKLNTPVLDWQGKPYDPSKGPAAHPNSRFTVKATSNPIYSPRAEDPRGVPISAIVFGGRRREVAPLVYEARSWQHGVLVGASVASETTAAATGAVGVVRRDPMAMKPFAGYNFGDYWRHWLDVGRKLEHPPKLFHVNWFRRDAGGKFLWPGYGENLRVMEWIIKRCTGAIGAEQSPIGQLPRIEDLNLEGTGVGEATMRELLAVQRDAWRKEIADMREYLKEFGARAPAQMTAELDGIEHRLAG
ncbi:MAG TPA: phosphoenolpyruvate carboxykinase (GTP) [Steroidobacteraceae bacterium]|jgi:phosphoenolpyruvate carboxykinase (GTP)|nr:phosphoenolpyruvate carboxykinase (GTP) [Steroidobacteraceae bacterium]